MNDVTAFPWLEVGTYPGGPPVPPVAELTTMYSAPGGVVHFGVEEREVGQDGGVCIHVFDTDHTELLRFDCFADGPHYHYIFRDRPQRIVAYDQAALGDMLDWTLSVLSTRLPQLLEHVDARGTAEAVQSTDLTQVLANIRQQVSNA